MIRSQSSCIRQTHVEIDQILRMWILWHILPHVDALSVACIVFWTDNVEKESKGSEIMPMLVKDVF